MKSIGVAMLCYQWNGMISEPPDNRASGSKAATENLSAGSETVPFQCVVCRFSSGLSNIGRGLIRVLKNNGFLVHIESRCLVITYCSWFQFPKHEELNWMEYVEVSVGESLFWIWLLNWHCTTLSVVQWLYIRVCCTSSNTNVLDSSQERSIRICST